MGAPPIFYRPGVNRETEKTVFAPAVVPSDPDAGPAELSQPPKTDRGVLFDPITGSSADCLKGMYRGIPCFLVCGGPSVEWSPLPLLRRRGILTASVNNVAATVIRPHLWFSCDAQNRFSETIWRDPAIMKFAKLKYCSEGHKWAGSKRQKPPHLSRWDGAQFSQINDRPADCPNVWGYLHTDFKHHPWNPETFFTQPLPSWGSSDKSNDPRGDSWHKSVMLVAIWLLRWLGVSTIYLLGCDFRMTEERPYAFDEAAKASSNNGLYTWLNDRFGELVPHLPAAGLQIVNCTVGGKLAHFPRLSLEEAVSRATALIPFKAHTRGQYF